MKKAALSGLSTFSMIEAYIPSIKSGDDILVKVSTVGICGSDIHYFQSGRIGNQIINYPFTPGHEFTGTIAEIGPTVQELKPGDRVAIDPAISCGHCDQCRANRSHTCRNLQFIGNPVELEGCLQEYIVVPAKCCFKLPEYISSNDGVIIEPLTIALHALDFMTKGGDIAVLGCGPIGLSTLYALKAGSESRHILMTDKIESRLEFAKSKGADWTGNPLGIDLVTEVKKMLPLGVDTVFECCGKPEAIYQAMEILKPGGQLIVIGIPEEDEIAVDFHTLRRKEITINNVRRQNGKFNKAIELMKSEKIDFKGLITHSFNIEQTQTAFETVASYSDGVIKAIIQLDVNP
jgi:L-iditol 2-dehydrogenase